MAADIPRPYRTEAMTDSYGSPRNEPPSIWNQARAPGAGAGGGAAAYPPWMTSPARPPSGPPPRPGRGIGAGIGGLAIAIVVLVAAGIVGIAVVRSPAPTNHRSNKPPLAQPARPTVPAGPTVPTTPGTSVTPVQPLTPVSPANPRPSNVAPPVAGKPLSASPAAIAALVNPAVVDINSQLGYQNAAAAGTGMVLTSSGLILTNNHVIDGATSIVATVVGTGRMYTATVVGVDPSRDVAVIQLQGASGLPTIRPGNPATVTPGDAVVAIGNAGGVGGAPSVVTGTVLATAQTVTATDTAGGNAERLTGLIETNAPLQPGDSGGPLVNGVGQIIGMDTAASSDTQFRSADIVSFAIPIDQAMAIASQIEAGQPIGTVRIGLPAFLGVQILVPSQARRGPPGAVVGAVVAGSPAASTGLVAGDVITSLDGQPVDSGPTLTTLLRRHRPGDTVTFGWTDQQSRPHQATVTLVTGPAD
jgi:S1-C subfamily serine protease